MALPAMAVADIKAVKNEPKQYENVESRIEKKEEFRFLPGDPACEEWARFTMLKNDKAAGAFIGKVLNKKSSSQKGGQSFQYQVEIVEPIFGDFKLFCPNKKNCGIKGNIEKGVRIEMFSKEVHGNFGGNGFLKFSAVELMNGKNYLFFISHEGMYIKNKKMAASVDVLTDHGIMTSVSRSSAELNRILPREIGENISIVSLRDFKKESDAKVTFDRRNSSDCASKYHVPRRIR